eukprot:g4985.t1
MAEKLPRRPTRTSPLESLGSGETELTGRSSQLNLDSCYGTSTELSYDLATPIISRENKLISFLNKHEIIAGVPCFVFRPVGNDKWAFRNFAVSADGTRMAFAFRPDILHVYDLLENFTLIAKADFNWCIDFLEFWNSRNDMLLIVFENRVVSVTAVIDRCNSFTTMHSFIKEDICDLPCICNYHISVKDWNCEYSFHEPSDKISNDVDLYWDFAASVAGSEMWIIQKDANGTLFISSVSQHHGVRQLRILSDCCIRPTRLLICIPKNALMAVYEHEDLRVNRTRIWKDLVFNTESAKTIPIELNGQGLCWSTNGNHVLIWRAEEDGANHVELHSTSVLHPKSIPSPLVYKSIGFGIVSLKAQFLDTEVSEFEPQEVNQRVPLIALLVTRSKGTSLLIWDCGQNDIIMEKDLTMEQVDLSKEIRIEFCVSPNLKWIAVGCWSNGVIGLFSFRSGTLVWSLDLELCQVDDPCFSPMMFDPLSSKLIINSDSTLFVFIPPCLLDHKSIDFQSSSFELDVMCQVSIPEFNEHHHRLMPKHVLEYLLALSLQSKVLVHSHYMYHIDIATSLTCSKLAVLVSGTTSVSIFLGTIDVFSSSSFRDYLESIFSDDHISHNFDEIKIRDFPLCPRPSSEGLPLHVFLHPIFGSLEESIALFSLEYGIVGLFIDPFDRNTKKKITFAEGHWFSVKQSQDNSCISCLGEEGVLIIHLDQRLVLQNIRFQSNIANRLHSFFSHNWENKHRPKNYTLRDILEEDLTATNLLLRTKKTGGFDVSSDGKSVLLGWDIIKQRRLILTCNMSNKNCEALQLRAGRLAPCWALDDDLEQVAYLEFDENNDLISAIGTYNHQNDHHFRLSADEWSLQVTENLHDVSTNDLLSYALQMDHSTGCLWLTMLIKDGHTKAKTTWIPISPYAVQDCVPCLYSRGYPARHMQIEELRKLVSRFGGSSMFNMAFNGLSNFQLIVEQGDEALLSNFLNIAAEENIQLDTRWKRWDGDQTHQSCLRKALDKKDNLMSKTAISSLERGLIPFQDSAFMVKECFQDLWTYYHTFLESILVKNLISVPKGQVEVPLDIFNFDKYVGARLGTSNTVLEWDHESDPKLLAKQWNCANAKSVDKIEKSGNATRVLASIQFFAVDDICKLGLNGLIRFLLMHQAPSHIFKTNMVQCVIIWKWENLWKTRCCRYFFLYFCFLVLFSIYAVCVEFVGDSKGNHIGSSYSMTLLLVVLMLAAMVNLYKEYAQLRTYIKDGKILFPKSRCWGLKYYFISRWNIIEVIAYILLLIVIPVLHFLGNRDPVFMPLLYGVVAVEAILIYSKLWYFAQAFRQTGALVFMIENVLRDCMSFLLMAFVVLVGFSISMFIVIQQFLHDYEMDKEDDPMQKIHDSFGNLIRVMVTLFYVMLGMFEPELFFLCGSLSPLIIVIFIAYLSSQMVVMLNMLIAIMGDTFDRVKNSEEEQLLLGKARFIDTCEAGLNDSEVQCIEKKIGKYLYVLVPVGQPAHQEFSLMQGKPRSVEDNVKKIIREHEETMKSMIEKNHEDFMIRMQDAKDLLSMTAETVKEFEKRCREHASQIEVNLTKSINERSKILERYLIIHHGHNMNDVDSITRHRNTHAGLPDALLREDSQESEDFSP